MNKQVAIQALERAARMQHVRSRSFSRRAFVGAACAAGLAPLLSGCSSASASGESNGSEVSATGSAEVQSATYFLYDTMVEIQAACSDELFQAACERLIYFEQLLSPALAGSDIVRINASAGEPVQVSTETAELLSRTLSFASETAGLFDVSVGAVSSLWDFKSAIIPDESSIASAITHVGYDKVQLEGTTVTLADPAAALDVGGVAKGYIADDVAGLLQEGGCVSAKLNLGGNVYALGSSFDGDAWEVGVRNPAGELDESLARIACADTTVVTSGPYERSFTADGVRYHHILDPQTGYPAQTDLESVTLACSDSTMADVYATALVMLGADAAKEVLSGGSFDGLLVLSNGEVWTPKGSAFTLI